MLRESRSLHDQEEDDDTEAAKQSLVEQDVDTCDHVAGRQSKITWDTTTQSGKDPCARSASLERLKSPRDSRGSNNRTTAIFMDPDRIKAIVTGNLEKPVYSVEGFYHSTGIWQAIARHHRFEQLTLMVIMLNAVWIAIDTDRNDSAALLEAEPVFQVAEHFFCIFFSFEWFVRFMAFKHKRNGLRDRWFVFDSCLVFMMVGETWIVTTVLLFTSSGSGGASGLGNASILRLFRLLRLSRMARMLRSFPELMILIKGITAATRSVLLVMVLLVIFMYIFAIAFTQLAKDTAMGKRYFVTVGTSMYSLLVYGTFLDNLAGVCMDIKSESFVCLMLFFVFIVFSALTLMNMLIGVLCEMVSSITATENEVRQVDIVTSKLEVILDTLDEDHNKRISRVEFMKILQMPEAVIALDEVGVDPVGIMDFADFIFDDTGTEADVSFHEFMDVVLKLRGSNTATVKDVVDLRRFIFSALENIQESLSHEEDDRPRRRMSLRTMPSQISHKPTTNTSRSTIVSTNFERAGPSHGTLTHHQASEQSTDGGFAGSQRSSCVDAHAGSRVLTPTNLNLEASGEREAMKRLQSRVDHLEESLTSLLSEVRRMSTHVPPVPRAFGDSPNAAAKANHQNNVAEMQALPLSSVLSPKTIADPSPKGANSKKRL